MNLPALGRGEHPARRVAGVSPGCGEHPCPIPGERDTVPVRAHLGEGSVLVAEHKGGNGWFLWFIALMFISVGCFFSLMFGLKSTS